MSPLSPDAAQPLKSLLAGRRRPPRGGSRCVENAFRFRGARACRECAGLLGIRTFILWPALVAVLSAMLIQVGTNLHNDVSRFRARRGYAGSPWSPRATAMGWLPAAAVRRGLGRLPAGLRIRDRPGCARWLAIVVIGLASLVSGWAYTNGPRPIALRRWVKSSCLFFRPCCRRRQHYPADAELFTGGSNCGSDAWRLRCGGDQRQQHPRSRHRRAGRQEHAGGSVSAGRR